MDISELKVGDYIMYDRGGCCNATFALVEDIEKRPMQFNKEKIVLHLKHIHHVKRVTEDNTINQNVFYYEYHDNFYITPDSKDMICKRLYKITKTEYDKISKAYDKFRKIREQTLDIFTKTYFDQK